MPFTKDNSAAQPSQVRIVYVSSAKRPFRGLPYRKLVVCSMQCVLPRHQAEVVNAAQDSRRPPKLTTMRARIAHEAARYAAGTENLRRWWPSSKVTAALLAWP